MKDNQDNLFANDDHNQNLNKHKKQKLNRISSISNKSNDKEDLEDSKIKHQEEIIKSKKSEITDKLRSISESDMKM